MAELKTRKTGASVEAFLDRVEDEGRRRDCLKVVELMRKATKAEPAMWGPGIVGFGSCRYRYKSGREIDWFLTGFSPRARSLSLYIMPGFDRFAGLMKKLGRYKIGKSCLYINRLEDVNVRALEELIRRSVEVMTQKRA